jgi:hypothetical protein
LPHDGYAHHPAPDISYIIILAYNPCERRCYLSCLLALRILGIGNYIDASSSF